MINATPMGSPANQPTNDNVTPVTNPTVPTATPPTPPSTQPNNKMPSQKRKMNWKMILGGLLLVVLVAGAGVGLFLSSQNQDIRQQASGCWCTGQSQCPSGWNWSGGDGYCSDGLKCCTESTSSSGGSSGGDSGSSTSCPSGAPTNCSVTCADGTKYSDSCPRTFSSCPAWENEACSGHGGVGSSSSSTGSTNTCAAGSASACVGVTLGNVCNGFLTDYYCIKNGADSNGNPICGCVNQSSSTEPDSGSGSTGGSCTQVGDCIDGKTCIYYGGTIQPVGASCGAGGTVISCGDGSCNGSEWCGSCPADCGACANESSTCSFTLGNSSCFGKNYGAVCLTSDNKEGTCNTSTSSTTDSNGRTSCYCTGGGTSESGCLSNADCSDGYACNTTTKQCYKTASSPDLDRHTCWTYNSSTNDCSSSTYLHVCGGTTYNTKSACLAAHSAPATKIADGQCLTPDSDCESGMSYFDGSCSYTETRCGIKTVSCDASYANKCHPNTAQKCVEKSGTYVWEYSSQCEGNSVLCYSLNLDCQQVALPQGQVCSSSPDYYSSYSDCDDASKGVVDNCYRVATTTSATGESQNTCIATKIYSGTCESNGAYDYLAQCNATFGASSTKIADGKCVGPAEDCTSGNSYFDASCPVTETRCGTKQTNDLCSVTNTCVSSKSQCCSGSAVSDLNNCSIPTPYRCISSETNTGGTGGTNQTSGLTCPDGRQAAIVVKFTCNGSDSPCANYGNGALECRQVPYQTSTTDALSLNGGCGQVDYYTAVDGNGNPDWSTYCGHSELNCTDCEGPVQSIEPEPSNPPVGPVCLSITPSITAPKIGDNVTFTCGRVSGATRYDFRLVYPDGTIQKQTGTESNNPSSISQAFTISQSGKYTAQCRLCVDGNCQAFESITQN